MGRIMKITKKIRTKVQTLNLLIKEVTKLSNKLVDVYDRDEEDPIITNNSSYLIMFLPVQIGITSITIPHIVRYAIWRSQYAKMNDVYIEKEKTIYVLNLYIKSIRRHLKQNK